MGRDVRPVLTAPHVSVLVATYNQAAWLPECIDAALAQDWPELEVVVADDGSTDETASLLADRKRRWGDRLVVVSGPNLGITRNCNRGLAACSGELIAFLGGDDVPLPGKIRAQLAWFADHADGVLCGHAVESFVSDTGEILPDPAINRIWGRGGLGPGALLEHGNLFAGPSVMVRRDAMPKYGFDERLPAVSDGKLWLDVLVGGGRWGAIPGVWVRYRRHPRSATASSFHRVYVEAFQARAIFEAEHPEYARECRIGRARLVYRRALHHLAAGQPEEARRYLRAAARMAPLLSWKLPIWAVIAALPDPARSRALAAVGATPPR